MKNYLFAILAMVFLSACSLKNEHDAAIQVAKYQSLTDINIALNKPNKVKCDAGCEIEIARENRVTFTAQMLQDFTAMDRLIAGGVSITEIIAKGLFDPATLQAYAMYKGLEVVSENSGTHIVNNDSYNSHSEANQANQQETVSGIKAGNDVDQSQQNQNNPVATDDNSVNNSNNPVDSNDDNSQSTTNNNEAVDAVVTP